MMDEYKQIINGDQTRDFFKEGRNYAKDKINFDDSKKTFDFPTIENALRDYKAVNRKGISLSQEQERAFINGYKDYIKEKIKTQINENDKDFKVNLDNGTKQPEKTNEESKQKASAKQEVTHTTFNELMYKEYKDYAISKLSIGRAKDNTLTFSCMSPEKALASYNNDIGKALNETEAEEFKRVYQTEIAKRVIRQVGPRTEKFVFNGTTISNIQQILKTKFDKKDKNGEKIDDDFAYEAFNSYLFYYNEILNQKINSELGTSLKENFETVIKKLEDIAKVPQGKEIKVEEIKELINEIKGLQENVTQGKLTSLIALDDISLLTNKVLTFSKTGLDNDKEMQFKTQLNKEMLDLLKRIPTRGSLDKVKKDKIRNRISDLSRKHGTLENRQRSMEIAAMAVLRNQLEHKNGKLDKENRQRIRNQNLIDERIDSFNGIKYVDSEKIKLKETTDKEKEKYLRRRDNALSKVAAGRNIKSDLIYKQATRHAINKLKRLDKKMFEKETIDVIYARMREKRVKLKGGTSIVLPTQVIDLDKFIRTR